MTTEPTEPILEASEDARKKADSLIGQTLAGNYEVIDLLGEGGMALVYKARQVSTDRIVAMKTLKTRDVNVMRRFQREMQTHAKLNHKNIVEAIDCFECNEQSFLVMDCVSGITLADLITNDGGIEKEEDIAAILSQICDALEHAHSSQVIHRDLKPANIILLDTEKVSIKVLDFGIAKLQDDMQKLTAEGQAIGSPLYMSPEQCMGEELSTRADLYSLGCLAYELVTGNLPYESARLVEIMRAHCDPSIKPQPIASHRPEIKGVTQLNQIIMRAVESDPDKRFQTAGEFKKAIEFWIQSVRGGSEQALPKDIATAAPKKVEPEQKARDKQSKAIQALVDKKVQNQTGPQPAQRQTGPQLAQDPNVPDTTKLILNFSLGLVVCCVSLGLVVGLYVNREHVGNAWKTVSVNVSSFLAKKPEPPQPSTAQPPDNQLPDHTVEPNPVSEDAVVPSPAERVNLPKRRRLLQ